MEIIRKDISTLKRYEKFGDLFKQIEDFGDNIYLYSRESAGPDTKGVYVYELVRGVPATGPDGTKVFTYPSTSHWGINGKTIWKSTSRERILAEVEKMKSKK